MSIKKLFILLPAILSFILITSSFTNAQQNPNDNDTPVIDSIDFRENLLDSNEVYKRQFDSLSKDGEWIKMDKAEFVRAMSAETGEEFDEYPYSGDYIYFWRPFCATSYWNPYTNGYWMFTSYGWSWFSYYNWGWGPYNYGRWYCSSYYGWTWIPGCTWASNWVSWRHCGNYVGWYPTCPNFYWSGHSNIYTNHLYAYVPRNWTFVDKKNFTKKIDNTTTVSTKENADILRKSQKYKPTVYVDPGMPKVKYSGPDVTEISRATGEKISPKYVETVNVRDKKIVEETNIVTNEREYAPPVKESNTNGTTTKTGDTGYKKSTKKEDNSGNTKTRGNTTTKRSGTKNNGTKNNGTKNNGTKNKGTKNNGSKNNGIKRTTPKKSSGEDSNESSNVNSNKGSTKTTTPDSTNDGSKNNTDENLNQDSGNKSESKDNSLNRSFSSESVE